MGYDEYYNNKHVFRHHVVPETNEGLDVGITTRRFATGRFRALICDTLTALGISFPGITGAGYVKVDGAGAFSNQVVPIPVTDGGTGGITAGAARTALGLGTLAVENDPLAVAKGGTGSGTAGGARTNLSVPATTEVILQTLADAKGDTIAATANDTWARKAVATNGAHIRSDSSVGDGLTYGALGRYISGLTLANNAGDATNDIDIAAGETASNDPLFANRRVMALTAMTKQLDAVWAVGTNQGMRASGAAIANTTYHIFAIFRDDTGVADIAADTSITGANISANTNVAYTKIVRIGSILREGGVIVPFTQTNDEFLRTTPILDVDVLNPGTAAVNRTLSVPLGGKFLARFNFEYQPQTAANGLVRVSDLAVTDAAASATVSPLGEMSVDGTVSNLAGMFMNLQRRVSTSAQIRTRVTQSVAGTIVRISTEGWTDDLRGM